MTTQAATKKITLSTVKSFVKKNRENLYINVKSKFDGMTDGVEPRKEGFKPIVEKATNIHTDLYEATLGIEGAWFVRDSRDYFYEFNQDGFTGYRISNSCGCFIFAIKA